MNNGGKTNDVLLEWVFDTRRCRFFFFFLIKRKVDYPERAGRVQTGLLRCGVIRHGNTYFIFLFFVRLVSIKTISFVFTSCILLRPQ